MEWAVFDGTPDETIDEIDQEWAMAKRQEFFYRKMFHLSKKEMAEEPLEDFYLNLKIHGLEVRREIQDQKIAEAKSRRK